MSTQNNLRNNAPRRTMDAARIYLILEGGTSLFVQLTMAIYVLYYALNVGMNPLQIVLVGTLFEGTIFLFELPTGVIADVYSRKLSVILGITLIGISLVIIGFVPIFGVILFAEVIMGIGFTFISGSTEAWISDEVGTEKANTLFLQAAQVRQVSSIVGIATSVALASIHLGLPIVISGILLIGLAIFLIVFMPETGFRGNRLSERGHRQHMISTLREGVKLIRLRRILIGILIVEFLFALHSEGFDHLWQLHVLQDFTLPILGTLNPIVWFGIIGIGANIVAIGLNEIYRRRLHFTLHRDTSKALMVIYGTMTVLIVIFALTSNFLVAVVGYWLIAALTTVRKPISDAWLNQYLEPETRATMFSINGQIGAVGEIIGGPPIGAIAVANSVRWGLAASGMILGLTLPYFVIALRQRNTVAEETIAVRP